MKVCQRVMRSSCGCGAVHALGKRASGHARIHATLCTVLMCRKHGGLAPEVVGKPSKLPAAAMSTKTSSMAEQHQK